jgi:hypothetical protein
MEGNEKFAKEGGGFNMPREEGKDGRVRVREEGGGQERGQGKAKG